MTKASTKKRYVLLLGTLLIFALLLCGCDIKGDIDKQKKLCVEMVDCVIADNVNGAYALVESAGTVEQFMPVWSEMRGVLSETETYEIESTGWNVNWNNGVETTRVSFEVNTDDGKTCNFTVTTGANGRIVGFHFLDATDFVRSTAFIPVINAVLTVISLGFTAFSIWMLVDAVKRRMKLKALWIIATVFYVGISASWGPSSFNFNTSMKLVLGLSKITAQSSSLSVAVNLLLPVGAVVYFLVRKKLTASFEAAEAAKNATGMTEQPSAEGAAAEINEAPQGPLDELRSYAIDPEAAEKEELSEDEETKEGPKEQ
jgi:hypothetical protein